MEPWADLPFLALMTILKKTVIPSQAKREAGPNHRLQCCKATVPQVLA